MRYFTKEWYRNCEAIIFHEILKVTRKAEVFSEEYFQFLYDKELKEFIEIQEELSRDVFKELLPFDSNNDVSPEELEEILAHIFPSDCFEKYPEDTVPIDGEDTTKRFHEIFHDGLERIKKLPKELLDQVADIRVLALNYCSKKVYELIRKNYFKQNALMDRAYEEYDRYINKCAETLPKELLEVSFHDCKIDKIEFKNNNMYISLDNSGGFTDCNMIIFKDYEFEGQASQLIGAHWLHDEIYCENGRYILCVLLDNLNEGLIEAEIRFSDVELIE